MVVTHLYSGAYGQKRKVADSALVIAARRRRNRAGCLLGRGGAIPTATAIARRLRRGGFRVRCGIVTRLRRGRRGEIMIIRLNMGRARGGSVRLTHANARYIFARCSRGKMRGDGSGGHGVHHTGWLIVDEQNRARGKARAVDNHRHLATGFAAALAAALVAARIRPMRANDACGGHRERWRLERAQGGGYLDARGPAQVGQRGAQIGCLLSMQAVKLVLQRGALSAIADLGDSVCRLLISLGDLAKRGERGGVIATASGGVERDEGRAGALKIIPRGGR